MRRSPFSAIALSLIAFATLLAVVPAPAPLPAAPALAATPPITVEDCHLDYSPGGILPLTKTVGPLHIDFRNDAKQPVIEARFKVHLNGRDVIIVDKGTFSPDVEIKHLFRNFSGGEHFLFSRQPQPHCSLVGATFADGSTWSPSAALAASTAATESVAQPPAPTSLAQFAGSWACVTAAGSQVVDTFTTATNGNVLLHQAWTKTNPAAGGTWDQTFTYNSAPGLWAVKVVGSNGWTFAGSSPGFVGNAILFTGIQNQGSARVLVRERFTVDSANRFEHVWERSSGASTATWEPSSYADCKRVAASLGS
ncbi:MAG: hypothetical protein HKL92_05040 [Candidatus Eremiobacteraeota bacterium]|nr:hypothetical protein [Candidatus Eremiobacteraeota bacterium]NNM92688.1 hypothetical protein [Candidatus Eremiobacteraeota bacterium]